jgi:peptide deformylase
VALLGIRVLGDPILRQETRPVTEFTPALRTLVADMFETMYAAQGIGLAAPQVGRTERLAIIDIEGERYAIVNPEIVLAEGEDKAEEGCLSIPDVYGDVERATRVVVRAVDPEGRPLEIDAHDLLARCLQHEIDHLHGKLFIDHLSVLKRRAALAQWADMKEKFPKYIRHLADEKASDHHREEL